jgi:hypothetical protein
VLEDALFGGFIVSGKHVFDGLLWIDVAGELRFEVSED